MRNPSMRLTICLLLMLLLAVPALAQGNDAPDSRLCGTWRVIYRIEDGLARREAAADTCVIADGQLTWRVLSNLLSNAVKYATPGTRVYVELAKEADKVLLSVRNVSREDIQYSAEELLERFVRGDASRNREGSGLGLNIAKSLMEVQGGSLQLVLDGDLFKIILTFPAI